MFFSDFFKNNRSEIKMLKAQRSKYLNHCVKTDCDKCQYRDKSKFSFEDDCEYTFYKNNDIEY